MLKRRKALRPVIGFSRYLTDGVSVFRHGRVQRLYSDGYHLVKSGGVAFSVVPKIVALAEGIVRVERKVKAKRKTKTKKLS